MIVASAVKLQNDSVYVGIRHGDCYNFIKLHLGDKELCINSTQGFINDKLQFLDREQAYYEAYTCGQCKKQEYVYLPIKGIDITEEMWHPCLFSEDLW